MISFHSLPSVCCYKFRVTRNSHCSVPGYTFVLHLMACSIKNAPPTEAAVNKLLSKVGGTLEQALNSQELKWSSKRLDADDAHVVAYVVALSTVLQKLEVSAHAEPGVAKVAPHSDVGAKVAHELVLAHTH